MEIEIGDLRPTKHDYYVIVDDQNKKLYHVVRYIAIKSKGVSSNRLFYWKQRGRQTSSRTTHGN